jgi:DNA-binding response OmpR family regulator
MKAMIHTGSDWSMKTITTVLIVDDDPLITDLLRDFLEAEGFGVETAESADDGLEILKARTVHCLILDVMLPGQSGFDLCRQIRKTQDLPILFLSARADDADKIRGLGLGGDDYIIKSVTPTEVVARVKAVMRRYQRHEIAPQIKLNFGPLVIDIRAREVSLNDHVIILTAREFDLLIFFAENPRQVFTSEQLLDRFWDGVGDRHTINVYMNRLREKIELQPTEPQYLITVWGVGYRFEGNIQ